MFGKPAGSMRQVCNVLTHFDTGLGALQFLPELWFSGQTYPYRAAVGVEYRDFAQAGGPLGLLRRRRARGARSEMGPGFKEHPRRVWSHVAPSVEPHQYRGALAAPPVVVHGPSASRGRDLARAPCAVHLQMPVSSHFRPGAATESTTRPSIAQRGHVAVRP